jgi:hypothetical protein
MADITSLVSAISGISALLSVGSASVSQIGNARRQWQPPQQQVQRCPLAPDGRPMQGQFRTLPDGTYQFICVEDVR